MLNYNPLLYKGGSGVALQLVLMSLFFLVCFLVTVAFFTLAERKIMAGVQRRKGPFIVGFFGFFQPVADGVKLLLKEFIVPRRASVFLFFLSPVLTFFLSYLLWFVFVFLFYHSFSFLFVYAFSTLGVFGIIGAGWSSNSKYAMLGALRSAAQMISYEVSLGFVFLTLIVCVESFSFFDLILYQLNVSLVFLLYPITVMFFIIGLAETNRAPFDLPEAEAEIVAGYNIEYSSIPFAMFFLGEYANMLILSFLIVCFFFADVSFFFFPFWFSLKIGIVSSFFILVRAALPRVRYDQLMYLGWQIFLPFSIGFFIFVVSIFFIDDLCFFWLNINYCTDVYDWVFFFND